jgi:hypothetical protein
MRLFGGVVWDPTPEETHYHLVMTNIAMENIHPFLIGKPYISMGHGFHGYVK